MLENMDPLSAETAGIYRPKALHPDRLEDRTRLTELRGDPRVSVFDTLIEQSAELLRNRNPRRVYSPEALSLLGREHVEAHGGEYYGNWFYYPWSRRAVRLLPEAEFAELRTCRNKYKITKEEQAHLATKRVGVIGLSVGKAVAMALAIERSFGELRIADFDHLELTNMNRIETGVHNLGLSKAILVARDIAELDPYLRVVVFERGIDLANLSRFFDEEGTLDCLIDECDGLDIKVAARQFAKARGIPVIMEMNDRCTVDIERFDLEPERPLLHGLMPDVSPSELTGLTTEEKIPFILPMLGEHTISTRLRASMLEIDETITGWPQLGSCVAMGGGVVADCYRRVMLGQHETSGRWFIDLDQLIAGAPLLTEPASPVRGSFGDSRLGAYELAQAIGSAPLRPNKQLNSHSARRIVQAATRAPSGANAQPWLWLFDRGQLWLFADPSRMGTHADFHDFCTLMSLGAAAESAQVAAASEGLELEIQYLEGEIGVDPVARLRLKGGREVERIDKALQARATHRASGPREPLSENQRRGLEQGASPLIPVLDEELILDPSTLDQLSTLFGDCDRVRFQHERAHREFFNEEVRWDEIHAKQEGDGVDLTSAEQRPSIMAGMKMAAHAEAVEFLTKWNLGSGLGKLAREALESASALWVLHTSNFTPPSCFEAGRALLRFWLKATRLDVGVHPMMSPAFLFTRARYGNTLECEGLNRDDLILQRQRFMEALHIHAERDPLFILKLMPGHEPRVRSQRRDFKEVYFSTEDA